MKRSLFALLVILLVSSAFAQDAGKIVIYRAKKFTGAALKPSIYLDGQQVARLGNGRYLALRLSTGKHKFESSMKHTAPLEVEVKNGEVSYIEMVILTGNWRGGGRLIPVSADDAEQVIPKLTPLDAKWIDAPQLVWGAGAEAQSVEAPTSHPTTQPSTRPTQQAQQQAAQAATPVAPAGEPSSVTVKSTPDGGDITLDGKFVGSTPSTLRLAPGDHTIAVAKSGFQPWQRTVTVSSGTNITVAATLDKNP